MTTTYNRAWVNPYSKVPIDPFWYVKPTLPRGVHHYDGELALSMMGTAAHMLQRYPKIEYYYREYGIDKPPHLVLSASLPQVTYETAQRLAWHAREQDRHSIHPVIAQVVRESPPDNWHLLLLEWPYIADSDPSRIAYTRSIEHGHADRQTLTSLGKYLRRHFSKLSDSRLRDFVLRYGPNKFELWDTSDKIVHAVQNGPVSCMQWGDDYERHPYEVYDPQYGWRIAVRMSSTGEIQGRCLVNDRHPRGKAFVRSYSTSESGGRSQADEALETWLRDQGYAKAGRWEGCRIAVVRVYGDLVMPYIDGGCQNITLLSDTLAEICDDGEYLCNNTDGTASYEAEHCDCCDNAFSSDELTTVGYDGEQRVCNGCLSDSFRYAYGYRGEQYHVHEDEATYCEYDDEWYVTEYATRFHNMVWLDNGDLCPADEAVYLEKREVHVHHESDSAVYCDQDGCHEHVGDVVELHDGEYALQENAWLCEISGDYYHNDDDADKCEVCDVSSKSHFVAHADNIDEHYALDLDDIIDAIADMAV
jgi:hypothetical protein